MGRCLRLAGWACVNGSSRRLVSAACWSRQCLLLREFGSECLYEDAAHGLIGCMVIRMIVGEFRTFGNRRLQRLQMSQRVSPSIVWISLPVRIQILRISHDRLELRVPVAEPRACALRC